MESQTQKTVVERRKNDRRSEGPVWKWFIGVVTLLLVAGFVLAHPPGFLGIPSTRLFKAGDNVGYNLGLVGGIMMLILLLYSLRKRFRFIDSWGVLPTWFRWHMILGIMGPALVIFHSTFSIRSINAGVALVCMMLVSGSGIFGRFFYTKIHKGLYGREETLRGLHEDMKNTNNFMNAISSFAPDIGRRLEQFRIRAEDKEKKGGFINSVLIEFEAASLSRSLTRDLHQAMHDKAPLQDRKARSIRSKLYQEYAANIQTYIKVLRDTAQFQTYERLFSLWHIFHIPLVYMMVTSGLYHVFAVHKY